MKFNQYVFRKYDIRGVVNEDFPKEFVIILGKSFGTYINRNEIKEIAISGDVRLSTNALKDYFIEGVLSSGVDVIDLGVLPTPVNYYSMWKLDVKASVQITGSHNPLNMNGFKMSVNKQSFFGEQIQQLKKTIENKDFDIGSGTLVKHNILNDYIEMILEKIKFEKKMNLVMDCGNATACVAAPQIFNKFNANITNIYDNIDGTFLNHHPDPSEEKNLKKIISIIKSGKYDAGLAFDGDADRIGIIDDKGKLVFPDQIMALMLSEIMKKGDKVVFDVKCSKTLEDEILRLGGIPIIWKTGHSLIKHKMKEISCNFAGEMSGHIFIGDNYFGFDDGIYVGARFIQMLSKQDIKLSELVSQLPKYYSTPEMRIECESDEEKFRIDKEISNFFKKNYDCLDIDGVRITFPNGWGLVRASNTQPVLVCRFEGSSEEKMNEIKNLVLNKLGSFGDIKIPKYE